jgi:hypothetical protein
MTCNEIREMLPDVAAGMNEATPEISNHLASCTGCGEQLEEFRQTMALLDEWQAPEPSTYFDVRLQARLREEMARPQAGWMQWFRRPMLATALTVVMGLGIGAFFTKDWIYTPAAKGPVAENVVIEPGSALGDLQALDKNHEIYSDFELLDDLTVQKDVVANP